VQNLLQSLQDHDLGHLKAIAELWGIELPSGSALDAATYISNTLSSNEFTTELIDSLAPDSRQVFRFLLDQGGGVPLPDLVRRFGQIREMGPGRRDREKPWRKPISPLEDLWYHGLCARTIVDTPSGAQEQMFIPEEIMRNLIAMSDQETQAFGHASPIPNTVVEAGPGVVEDLTTLLAYLRRETWRSQDQWHLPDEMKPFFHQPASVELLLTLLLEEAIVDQSSMQPKPEETKTLLESSPARIISHLQETWIRSSKCNDLAHVPGLSVANDEWPNDPLVTRGAILDQVRRIPRGEWWDIEGFVSDFHNSRPSFQRPAGDFDSWYLLGEEEGKFLRGFEYWDQVEGDLIRYVLSRPMHWLGVTDIGFRADGLQATAFRLSPWANAFLGAQSTQERKLDVGNIRLQPDGRVRAAKYSDRVFRYQISRFTDWVAFDGEEYTYHITPSSLQLAAESGLRVEHINSILSAACEYVPPAIIKALRRWEAKGAEARLEKNLVLHVQESEILETLLSNPRTARYILETLNPTTALIQEASFEKLLRAAAQAGLFIDPPGDFNLT
jgi:hypothetical protein